MLSTTLHNQINQDQKIDSQPQVKLKQLMTVIQQQISNIEIENKQKRQRLGQWKSMIVTIDLLHMSKYGKITYALSILW